MKLIGTLDMYQDKAMYSIEELLTLDIAIPDVQRSVDEDRVVEIIEYQTNHFKTRNTFCFIGDILLASSGPHQYIILDGMHRYMAMKRIYMLQPTYNIGVTIVKDNTSMSYQEIFMLINKSKPVPDHVITTTMDLHKRSMLEVFKNHFTSEFKIYVSKSQSPKRPNVNMDTLLNNIAKSHNLIESCGSGKIIFQYMKFVNTNYWRQLDPKNAVRCSEKSQKYNSFPLFISNDVDGRWLNDKVWFDVFSKSYLTCLAHEVASLAPPPPPSKSLPKSVRMTLWKKHFAQSTNGTCVICREDINISNFECGHVVSRHNGGSDALSNLLPVCGPCNKSIGKTNMVEFCQKYEINIELQ